MTADPSRPDGDVPVTDSTSDAARRALRLLAATHPGRRFSWATVEARAQHVRRIRLAALVAACAVVLAGTGTAVAAVNRDPDRVSILRDESTTTTTGEASTSTSATASTTDCPFGICANGDPTSPVAPTTPADPGTPAEAADLQATLTLTSPRLFAERPNTYTLTVRNTTDHAVAFSAERQLGVAVNAGNNGAFPVHELDVVLAAGEQRMFTSEITPAAEMVGTALISAAVLVANRAPDGGPPIPYVIGPVPYIEAKVVPRNYAEGQPVDPGLGRWAVAMTADAEIAPVGQPVALHATLRNIGDQPQLTKGYGALAVVCFANDRGPIVATWAQFIDAATLAPGAEQPFTVNFRPTDAFVSTSGGYTSCMVGVGYKDDLEHIAPLPNLNDVPETFSVDIKVSAAGAPTTTTTTTTP